MNQKKFPPLMRDAVQAGFPSPAEHYIEKELDVNDYLAPCPDAAYFVRVTGESMIGANIFPGDILCVDRTLDFFDGAIVVASIDGEFTVKFLRRERGGIRFESANAEYPPIRITPAQDVRFWGVVTGVVRKLRYSGLRRFVPEPATPAAAPSSPPPPPSSPGAVPVPGRTRERYQKRVAGQAKP